MGDRDTLTSVAARFDTTPSELTKLNRLGSTFIYSGQQLWVPAKGEGRPGGGPTIDAPSPDPSHESQDDLPQEEKGNFFKYVQRLRFLIYTLIGQHLDRDFLSNFNVSTTV